jgi:hypothetical protein
VVNNQFTTTTSIVPSLVRADSFDLAMYIKRDHIHHIEFNRPIHNDMYFPRNGVCAFINRQYSNLNAFGFSEIFGGSECVNDLRQLV